MVRFVFQRTSSRQKASAEAALTNASDNQSIDDLVVALNDAKAQGVDTNRIAAAQADLQGLLDKRLHEAQAMQLDKDSVRLRRAIEQAANGKVNDSALTRLEAALNEGRESGLPSELLAEGINALSDGRAKVLENALRAAIARQSDTALYTAIKDAKKAAERRDGTHVRVGRELMVEAEEALRVTRRAAQKTAMLERTMEMAGPAALERALAAARHDPHMPEETVARAEAVLQERRREQRYHRLLEALQEAQQKALEERRARWRFKRVRLPDWPCPRCTFVNNGPMPFCEMCEADRPAAHVAAAMAAAGETSDDAQAEELRQLGALAVEVRRRLDDPRAWPPAWLHFLRVAYAQFPAPGLRPEQLNKARARLQQAAKSRIARTVPRALMEFIRLYHPDKNRVEDHGPLWAKVAEALTKIATHLLGEYKAKIQAQAAEV